MSIGESEEGAGFMNISLDLPLSYIEKEQVISF